MTFSPIKSEYRNTSTPVDQTSQSTPAKNKQVNK